MKMIVEVAANLVASSVGDRLEDDCEDGREWLWRWLLGVCELDCQDGYEVACKRIHLACEMAANL